MPKPKKTEKITRVRIRNGEATCPFCTARVITWRDAEGVHDRHACPHYVTPWERCGQYAEFRVPEDSPLN
jgi:hypothetical protein